MEHFQKPAIHEAQSRSQQSRKTPSPIDLVIWLCYLTVLQLLWTNKPGYYVFEPVTNTSPDLPMDWLSRLMRAGSTIASVNGLRATRGTFVGWMCCRPLILEHLTVILLREIFSTKAVHSFHKYQSEFLKRTGVTFLYGSRAGLSGH